jgi:hypothetical protein
MPEQRTKDEEVSPVTAQLPVTEVAMQQKNWRVEEALRDHFATHTTTQWLAKVTSLQSELRQLKESFP